MKNKHLLSNIFIGILFTIFFICLSIFAVIHFRPLYYFDINYLNIESMSGYSKDIILENYNSLMDYCSPFYHGSLVFPSLSITDAAYVHFERVKKIFDGSFYIGCILFFILIGIMIYKYRKKDFSYLKISSIVIFILPSLLGAACGINWDNTFILFHKIFFKGDHWLFDWDTDQIIRILPDTYFLHCAICMIGIVLLGSLITFLCHLYTKKHKNNFTPQSKNTDCQTNKIML